MSATSTPGARRYIEHGRRLWAVGSGSAFARFTGRTVGRAGPRMEAMQHWSADRVRAFRSERLSALLRHAAENVPFYRERLATADVFGRGLTDEDRLCRIPLLTKDDLRNAGAAMVATDRKRMTHVATTSGSSGSPVRVRTDYEAMSWVRAAERRAFRWYGVEPFEPRVFLLSAPSQGLTRLKHKVVDLTIGRRLFGFHDLSQAQLLSVARYIQDYRPSFVTAYPSVLSALCLACIDAGVSLAASGVRLLQSQSEMLLPHHVEVAREVFGAVPILNGYGCVEVGAMAYTCPSGGFHPSHDHVWFEVVNDAGQPVGLGESGRIALTPLHCRAMPLIRYDVGDRAVLEPYSCDCGRFRGLPMIRRLEGRTFETIVGRSNERFSGGIVHFVLKSAGVAPKVREFLAVQEQRGELRFDLVLRASGEALEAAIRSAGESVFGNSITITVREVSEIDRPKTEGGSRKQAYFISRVERAS